MKIANSNSSFQISANYVKSVLVKVGHFHQVAKIFSNVSLVVPFSYSKQSDFYYLVRTNSGNQVYLTRSKYNFIPVYI